MYYTYYSYEEWGRGYIGYHRCPNKKSPETDGYYGSFKDKTFKPTQKVILDLYQTRTEALNAEIILHDYFKVDVNPHFANKVKQTSTGFSSPKIPWNKGKKASKEATQKRIETMRRKGLFEVSAKKRLETMRKRYTPDEIQSFWEKGLRVMNSKKT